MGGEVTVMDCKVDKNTPRKQCAKCPWKKSVNAYDIPGGYSRTKHAALKSTIAESGSLRGLGGKSYTMACHETGRGEELACVGWLSNQLGPGNNIGLRMQVAFGSVDGNIETIGEQHARFEDTLPKRKRAPRRLPVTP